MYDASKPNSFNISGATITMPINWAATVVSWNTEFAAKSWLRGTKLGTAALAAGR